MTENNTETKIQTESQSMSESNKPWYKKKNTIIAASSILGAGVLATVIAVPIALTTDNTTTVDPIKETVTALNGVNNKVTRIDLWNKYGTFLNTVPTATPFKNSRAITADSPLSKIVYTPAFVTEFIDFMIDNLNVTTAGTEIGAITQVNADLIKAGLIEKRTLFETNPTPTTSVLEYANGLFKFGTSTDGPILFFQDLKDTTNQTIDIKFYMPSTGLDLTYNDDKTVSFAIPAEPASGTLLTPEQHVRLVVTKFANPAITTATTYYFKPNSTIKLPSTFMTEFATFFQNNVTNEAIERDNFQKNYQTFKTSADATLTNGISYWNSFAINFAPSNKTLLLADFKKEVATSSFYTFIKDALGTQLLSSDLNELKTALSSTTATEVNLSNTPFVQSPSYSHLLFDTNGNTKNKYSLELDITKFTYDFTIDNLFNGPSAFKITPKLTLGGTLNKIAADGKITPLTFASKEFDVSNLINITRSASFSTGGLLGFLDKISDTTIGLGQVTKGLVAFNNKDKTPADQMTAWNTFNTVTTNQDLIIAELKKDNPVNSNPLFEFVTKNADLSNSFGHGTAFPTIVSDTFATSFITQAKALTSANLSFVVDATNTTTGAIILQGVKWGTENTNLFTNITFYFGHETNTISNINLTSPTAGGIDMSLSQTVGDTTTTSLDTKDKVIAAAKKRLSIVFETATSTHVVYLGQKAVGTPAAQVANPIIIPNSILTSATKFADFIIALK